MVGLSFQGTVMAEEMPVGPNLTPHCSVGPSSKVHVGGVSRALEPKSNIKVKENLNSTARN